MRKTFFCMLVAFMAAVMLMISFRGAAAADDPKEFYKRKVMKLMVPFRPGGGFDIYSRALSPYLKKHLGLKTVVIINKPGAGGNIAYNDLYNATRPDGLTIVIAQAETLAFSNLWQLPEAKYQPSKFSFLGRIVWEEGTTVLSADSPLKSMQDVQNAKTVKAACAGTGSAKSGTAASVAFYALGLKNLKKVVGYGGSREALTALLRGEADIGPGYSVSGILAFVKAGKLTPLWVDARERASDLPDTPTIFELGLNKAQQKPLELYINSLQLGRTLIGPPGIPKDRLAFLADAVAKAIQDPGYHKALKKMKRDMPRFLEGAKTLQLMKQTVEISQKEKDELKKAVFELGF